MSPFSALGVSLLGLSNLLHIKEFVPPPPQYSHT
jgi:hypothetical protein